MRRVLIAALIGAGTIAVAVAQPSGGASYKVTPKSEQKMTPAPGGLYSTSPLGQHANSMALITARTKTGEAEMHAGWEDHIFVQEGEANLTLGGSIENPHTVGKGETRGSGISGGKTVAVHPGDYIFVPVNTPHLMVLAPGKSIRYAVVKTKP